MKYALLFFTIIVVSPLAFSMSKIEKQAIFAKRVKRIFKPHRYKCHVSRNEIRELIDYRKKEKLNFPPGITEQTLKSHGLKELRGLSPEKRSKCFYDLVFDMKCEPLQNALYNIMRLSSQYYVKDQYDEIYSKNLKSCKNEGDKLLLEILKPDLEALTEKSAWTGYQFLKQKLYDVINVEDHRPLYAEIEKLAKEIGRPDLIEEVARMPSEMFFPLSEQVEELLSARKRTCTNVDNTDIYIRRDYNQGTTNACFSFGAANLMNFHLGIDGVNPLFLYTLAIATNDAPWYYLEGVYLNSNSGFTGGYASGPIREALKLGRICKRDDLFDPKTGGQDIKTVIIAAEVEGEACINLHKKLKAGKIAEGEFKQKVSKIFNSSSSATRIAFPKASLDEFINVVKSTSDPMEYFRAMVLSQCKTKLSPEEKRMRVKADYSFGPSTISFKKIDEMINNGSVGALGFHAFYVLQGDINDSWSPHIVTLSGRRWNEEKNVCEYRIVNSWGGECKQVTNLDIDCDDENGLWVKESYIRQYGNSLTTIIDSPRMKEKELERSDQNYEPYDPDF